MNISISHWSQHTLSPQRMLEQTQTTRAITSMTRNFEVAALREDQKCTLPHSKRLQCHYLILHFQHLRMSHRSQQHRAVWQLKIFHLVTTSAPRPVKQTKYCGLGPAPSSQPHQTGACI